MRLPTSPTARDCLLAALLTVVGQVELVAADGVDGPLWLQHLAFVIITGSVALRRRAPLAAMVVCAAGLALQSLAGDAPVVSSLVALLIVAASLGYYASLREGLVGLAVAAASLVYDLRGGLSVADLVGNSVIVVVIWGGSAALRRSTDRRIAVELERDRVAREAILAERSRIARELHDSVAHAVTLMTLQAGNVRERTSDPDVAATLRSIEDGGREAVEDMHRFLRVVAFDAEAAAREAPGLRDLDNLVARVRAGGLDVVLHVSPQAYAVPASLSATAYRVVQEALTNTVRHTHAERTTVSVAVDATAMLVEVRDDGAAPLTGPSTTGAGRGLAGLRERAALFGGSLIAGPAAGPDGAPSGWQVVASFPVAGGDA